MQVVAPQCALAPDPCRKDGHRRERLGGQGPAEQRLRKMNKADLESQLALIYVRGTRWMTSNSDSSGFLRTTVKCSNVPYFHMGIRFGSYEIDALQANSNDLL